MLHLLPLGLCQSPKPQQTVIMLLDISAGALVKCNRLIMLKMTVHCTHGHTDVQAQSVMRHPNALDADQWEATEASRLCLLPCTPWSLCQRWLSLLAAFSIVTSPSGISRPIRWLQLFCCIPTHLLTHSCLLSHLPV